MEVDMEFSAKDENLETIVKSKVKTLPVQEQKQIYGFCETQISRFMKRFSLVYDMPWTLGKSHRTPLPNRSRWSHSTIVPR